MERRGQTRSALAIVAATAGTGYASGRELVLFFAQLGWAGWIGIAFAAALFGLLTALLCRCATRWNEKSFAGLCRRLLGKKAAAVALWLYGLMLALTAAVMLYAAGELGALTLPLRFGAYWGAGLALLLALAACLCRLRPLPLAGLAVLVSGVALYAALALDPRPVRVYLHGHVELALEGSVSASILLALAYAAMNASLSAGVATRFARGTRPAWVGLLCGAMLAALLLCANAAVARGGRELLFQAMPTVILAARWGIFGFWLCAGFGFLCAATTLAAALGGLIELLGDSGRRPRGWGTALALAALFAALALSREAVAVYPAVGWLCAALLMALACRADSLLWRRGSKQSVR